MLSPREAFQVGFLARCAELGLTADETVKVAAAAGQLSKQALLGLEQLPGIASGALKSTLGLGQLGLAGLAAAPLAGGAALGYGLGRMTDIDDEDVDSIKQQELIDEYLRQAEQLRHRGRRYRSLRLAG